MSLNFRAYCLNSSNMFLKEFRFPHFWKVSLVAPVFKNVGERSIAKNYHPVLLFVISKVCKKLR